MKKIFHHALSFFSHILEKKYLIYELTIRDFSSKYSSSYLGNIWAVMDAMFFIGILWLIFGIVRKAGSVEGAPYIAFLSVGFLVYAIFDATISSGTGALKSYSFLMHRVDFRPSILPVVMLFSNILKHFCVMGTVIVILMFNGVWPSFYWLQSLYYLFAMGVLLLGITWATSSISPFFPDINNIINVILRFFFFGSPIFWSAEQYSQKAQTILAINPLYYIITGYRDSFIYHKPVWSHPELALYFWLLTFLVVLIGATVHMRLKPHFMDVL